MLELLSHYSISDILVFLIMVALATKGLVNFCDWGRERVTKWVHRDQRVGDLSKEFQLKQEKITKKLDQMDEQHDACILALQKKDEFFQRQLMLMKGCIEDLIESDKDDIKAWITEQYHYFSKVGKIDTYSLECINKRFDHYTKWGGNSFVKSLVEELNNLPKLDAAELLAQEKARRENKTQQ